MPTIKERRLELDRRLREICEHVYFQPPESVRMQYPAIRYKLNDIDIYHADNTVYLKYLRFQITVIDKDPDSAVSEALSNFRGCRFDRSYASDNLNHFVYELYI